MSGFSISVEWDEENKVFVASSWLFGGLHCAYGHNIRDAVDTLLTDLCCEPLPEVRFEDEV